MGAFSSRENADRRIALLRSGGIGTGFVHEDPAGDPALFRVRIGPVADVVQYDSIVERLQNLGISDTHLVTD